MPKMIRGTSVSTGLAMGAVHVVSTGVDTVPVFTVAPSMLQAEVDRLSEAVSLAMAELDRRHRVVASQAGRQEAEIFSVQKLVLQDPGALNEVEAKIRVERVNRVAMGSRDDETDHRGEPCGVCNRLDMMRWEQAPRLRSFTVNSRLAPRASPFSELLP